MTKDGGRASLEHGYWVLATVSHWQHFPDQTTLWSVVGREHVAPIRRESYPSRPRRGRLKQSCLLAVRGKRRSRPRCRQQPLPLAGPQRIQIDFQIGHGSSTGAKRHQLFATHKLFKRPHDDGRLGLAFCRFHRLRKQIVRQIQCGFHFASSTYGSNRMICIS